MVVLVGYTNAGKSSLFNRITGAKVYAADRLFATLDPTLRRWSPAGGSPIILSDTVGFIRHLPHDLVAAFRATLEQVKEADLLLHVIDARSEQREERVSAVAQVIEDLGARCVPQIQVFNKLDLLPDATPRMERDASSDSLQVWVSATTGAGLDLLGRAIVESLDRGLTKTWVKLPAGAARLRAKLYDTGTVIEETMDAEGGCLLEVDMPIVRLRRLHQSEGVAFYPVAGHGLGPYDPIVAHNN
jgi:GTP-binding protein HflX